jgi:predicted metalloprotease
MPRLTRLLAASLGLALSATTFAGSVHAASPSASASAASFISSKVIPDIDGYWRLESRSEGVAYSTPAVTLFDSAHPAYDACGTGPVAGHEYCNADHTIYLDVGTDDSAAFGQLWATDSNFTIVTIIAHEWGHAIQDQRQAFNPSLSRIDMEHQADCLSGVFGRYAAANGWLDPGDLDAALALALRSGDPGHGPGWQRQMQFEIGYNGGSPAACNLA